MQCEDIHTIYLTRISALFDIFPTVWCNHMGTVLDNVYMAVRGEDSISEQIREKQIFSDFDHEDLNFKGDWRKYVHT